MRALLCGYGSMGKNHFRVMKHAPRIRHLDVFDPYTEIPGEYRVDDIEAYLDAQRPELAIVATPTVTHGDIAQKVLTRSIPTLIEKPIASNVEEGKRIHDVAVSHQVKGAVGFVERFNPVVHALKMEIQNCSVLSIGITRVGPFPPRIKDVGVLVDLSVHDIDLVRFLLDGAEVLESRVYKSLKNNGNFEDNAVLTMRMEGDIIVNLTTNWLTPFKKRTIEIATDKAYFEANLITQELKAYSHYETNHSHVVRSCYVPRGEPLSLQLDAFLDYIEKDKPGFLASYRDGIEALQILEKRRWN